MSNPAGYLFVTGTTRSGTTLYGKLLGTHPAVRLALQPFPLLYPTAMHDFHQSCGREVPLPLGNLFLESRYATEDLESFLDSYQPKRERLEEVFTSMEAYSGRMTTVPLPASLDPGRSFAELFKALHDPLAGGEPCWVGSKEVLSEELAPYLASRGVHCVLMVRDPRDVVSSTIMAGGERWVGRTRPLLFTLRNWRKSIAVAAVLNGRPGCTVVRYEDVVANPEPTMTRSIEKLYIDPAPIDIFAALDGWEGNSSEGALRGLSAAPVGRYRNVLQASVIRYVETACFAEMVWLGYQPLLTDGPEPSALTAFTEPAPIVRTDVDPAMSSNPVEVAAEARRISLLREGAASLAEQKLFFRFPEAYQALTAAVRGGATLIGEGGP